MKYKGAFKVVRSGSSEAFEATVNIMLADGWKLHGPTHHSVSWAIGPNGRPNGLVMNELYVQTMVRQP